MQLSTKRNEADSVFHIRGLTPRRVLVHRITHVNVSDDRNHICIYPDIFEYQSQRLVSGRPEWSDMRAPNITAQWRLTGCRLLWQPHSVSDLSAPSIRPSSSHMHGSAKFFRYTVRQEHWSSWVTVVHTFRQVLVCGLLICTHGACQVCYLWMCNSIYHVSVCLSVFVCVCLSAVLPDFNYTVFQKKIHSYKLRSSCLILIIFDIKIPHVIWHCMTA